MSWSDGWPTKYDNWGNDLEVGVDKDLCGQYNTTDGKWYITSCDQELSFACKYSESKRPKEYFCRQNNCNKRLIAEVPPTPGPFGECPDDWEDLPGPFCYSMPEESGLRVQKFSEALFQCQKRGGSLLSIEDEEENARVQKFIQDIDHDVWLGLVDVGDGGIFVTYPMILCHL